MFKNLIKQKKEIMFAAITLLISAILMTVAIWSLQFLVVRLNGALEESKVSPGEVPKFNLDDFEKLKLGQ